jgi:hypothetical protein
MREVGVEKVSEEDEKKERGMTGKDCSKDGVRFGVIFCHLHFPHYSSFNRILKKGRETVDPRLRLKYSTY